MSQENVEIVRRAFAEFARGNFWVPELFDPDVRIVWLDATAPGTGESRGLEGLARGMKGFLEAFDDVTSVSDRIIDAGEQVVVIARWHGRGKASGADTEWRYGAVWTLRNGKVVSVVSYSDPAEALKAVGLEESPPLPQEDAEHAIRRYVAAMAAADGDRAAALTADNAVIELPNGVALEGKEGARRFAAKHAEHDGQQRSVKLTSLEARDADRFLATLEMSNREIATDELLYSMDVGSIFELREGLIVRQRVFPSADDAVKALGPKQ